MKKSQVLFLILVAVFILLCSLKSALFNYYVTDSISSYSFEVKLAVFSNILFLTLLTYLLALRSRSKRIFLLIYIGQAFYVFVNLMYYFYFEGYLHYNQYFELWPETLELMKHSALPFEPRMLIVFIDIPFFFIILINYKKINGMLKTPFYRFGSYVPALFLLWNFHKWDWIKDYTPMQTMSDQYTSEVATVKKFGLLTVNLYHLFYFKAYENLIRQFNYGKQIVKKSTDIDSCASQNNIVIIQIESMDAFIINKTYRHQKVAANLYAMSRQYIYYPYMLSYHKAGSTSDCEFSCVNSVEALDMFPSIKLRNYDFPNSLPKRFASNNYEIAIYHGNRGEYFNRRIAFKKMGFTSFFDIDDMHLKEVVWGAPDGDVLRFMNNKILAAQKPFYYHVITMSSHEPFTFVQPYYSTKKFNGISDQIVKNYFTCISYVDSVVSQFIRSVQHEHPNTYFFIYGDHTPAIKNNRNYTQAAYKDNSLYFEYVPLIIITPDKIKHFENKRAVSFLDIAPTALASAAMPYEISSLGENLLAPDSLKGKVPYRGVKFTREELFKKINFLYVKSNKTSLK